MNLLRDVWEWPSVRTQCCNDVKLAALTYIKGGKCGPFPNGIRKSSGKLVIRKPYLTSLAPVSNALGEGACELVAGRLGLAKCKNTMLLSWPN